MRYVDAGVPTRDWLGVSVSVSVSMCEVVVVVVSGWRAWVYCTRMTGWDGRGSINQEPGEGSSPMTEPTMTTIPPWWISQG
jgi:hypothetical protein